MYTESNPAHEFIATDRLHHRVVEKYVKDMGLHRGTHMLLMDLNRHGKLSQSEIAEKMRISTAAVTVKLQSLEKDGLIKRSTDSDDCRIKSVTITEKGKDIVSRTKEIFEMIDSKMIENISSDELDVFVSVLQKMNENLNRLNDQKEENS